MSTDNDIITQSTDRTVSVMCANSWISDTDLPLGTGPLFNFDSILEQPHLSPSFRVETSLSHCLLQNITSSPTSVLHQGGSNEHSQKMIGVEVSGCTNHLYGTICHDMNKGGSVLCLNSSFSRCSTSLEPSSTHPTYILQHRTGAEQRFELPPTDSSSVSFSHCTFLSMTTSKFPGGGAIELKSGCSAVSITTCSFINCTATFRAGSGGAVNVLFNENSSQSVSFLSCVFAGCHAPTRGGSIGVRGNDYISSSIPSISHQVLIRPLL
ncbi:hypothetical protein BLNAU_23236 [Blattamonas nauphoetae]|uniref:Uncharacterized protein n=1 Tax=Blattamonas nauphoetae TaxID=2049346 RepID=A0ABQ9WUY3_9EUKA|nr:hypothetical protein BLNAU_23236 [Blattamonas nauphoetae]